jgi:hypothetical protein
LRVVRDAPAYRADTRTPDVVFAEGFATRSDSRVLWIHLRNLGPSGYVSTTTKREFARWWADRPTLDPDGRQYSYEVRVREGIDVRHAAEADGSEFADIADQYEIAAVGSIDPTDVKGAWIVEPDGTEHFLANPAFAAD